MIELEVNGDPYTDFMTAEATLSMRTLANDFIFTASSVNGIPPFNVGDSVVVLVDRVKVLTGYINRIDGKIIEESHTITYSGRDKTSDLVDSQLNIVGDIFSNDSLTLKGLIEIILKHLQLDLKVIDKLNADPFTGEELPSTTTTIFFNKAEDLLSPKVGQSALEFLFDWTYKRQALLSSDPEGNIVITQSSPVDSGAVVQSLIKSDTNNIIDMNFTLNQDVLFSRYIIRGQLDPRPLNLAGETDIASIENQGAEVADDLQRVGRQKVVVEQISYSNDQLLKRAEWAQQLAKADATRVNCMVKGHQMPGDTGLWKENTLVQVNIEGFTVNRLMLIETLTYSQADGSQSVTDLQLVEKDVYTINAASLNQKPAGEQFSAYFFR